MLTIFPRMLNAIQEEGITGRAIKKGLLTLRTWDLRDYALNRYGTVDDRPYGGGPGMVMMAPPLQAALGDAKLAAPNPARIIYVSPAGKRFDQDQARALATAKLPLIFIAGRYEGVDQRVIDKTVDEHISIGDYVLSGGELAVMVVIDALTRLLPGALGHTLSASQDSFSRENEGLLDCPHYTRPAVWDGECVPEVLLKGNHEAIARWRKKQSLRQTWLHRPDLLKKMDLDEEKKTLLAECQQEEKVG